MSHHAKFVLALATSATMAAAQDPFYAVAQASGGGGVVLFRPGSSNSLSPYGSSFTGGVRVAVGDVNGDGIDDLITGAGPGGSAHVKVFSDGNGAELKSFFAFDGFSGGVNVAAGDVNGDGKADIIVGAGAGSSPTVRVFDGNTGSVLSSFLAFDAGFTGGVSVAAGDVNGDGIPDIVTSTGPGGAPHVRVFDGADGSLESSFLAFDAGFSGGVNVASGDVDGDGKADIVVGAGPGGGPQVRIFDGATGTLDSDFLAFSPSFTGGVTVGLLQGDFQNFLITGAESASGLYQLVFPNGVVLGSDTPFGPSFSGGLYVAGPTFDPVPEPASALALALGLGIVRRRRR